MLTFQVEPRCDATAWDAFVSSQSAGHFMQSYAWGQFQRELGWDAHYARLNDGENIRAAALLLARGVPGIGKVFYAPRGPAVDFADQPATQRLFDEIAAFVKKQGGIFLRCDPYWTVSETESGPPLPKTLKRVPRDWSYWNAPRFVFWLDLRGDEESIFNRIDKKDRSEIRRGYREGTIFSLGNEEAIVEFHRLMVLTGNKKGIAFHGIEFYQKLYAMVNASAKVQLFLGRVESGAVTAGMSVVYGKKAWLLYAASAPEAYKLRANRTQQWEMIKWAHGLGCERYDFRGTATNDPPSPKDPGYGVYEFKKSFGPEFTRLTGYYDLVQRPLLYRMFRVAEERVLPAAYRVRTWLQERK